MAKEMKISGEKIQMLKGKEVEEPEGLSSLIWSGGAYVVLELETETPEIHVPMLRRGKRKTRKKQDGFWLHSLLS